MSNKKSLAILLLSFCLCLSACGQGAATTAQETVPSMEAPTVPVTQSTAAPETEAPTVPVAQSTAAPATEAPTVPVAQSTAAPETEAPTVPAAQSTAAAETKTSAAAESGEVTPVGSGLTRRDLEAAVVELAYDYFFKKGQLQYCSQELNADFLKFYGGNYRLTDNVAPEFGTSDTTIYTVCSGYTYLVYREALDYGILGADCYLDAVTSALWRFCENQYPAVLAGRENTDICLARYIRDGYTLPSNDVKAGVTTDGPHVLSRGEMREFLSDWEHNLRPGDIILPAGHATLYIGNGYLLECSGKKYNLNTGMEAFEKAGIIGPTSVVTYFVDSGCLKAGSAAEKDTLAVLRPLNALCLDDGDDDPANDPVKADYDGFKPATVSRLTYPALEIDKTVNITPYGTVYPGETLTYTLRITNHSAEKAYVRAGFPASGTAYQALPVREYVPEGCSLVSADAVGGDCRVTGRLLEWAPDVLPGETVLLSYTVQVDAAPDSEIVNEGGFAADIPTASIRNRVGCRAPAQEQLARLDGLAELSPAELKEQLGLDAAAIATDVVNAMYKAAFGFDPELSDQKGLAHLIFDYEYVNAPAISRSLYFGSKYFANYVLKSAGPLSKTEEKLRAMLVDQYYGGRHVYCREGNVLIKEFRPEYLMPGDILVYSTGTPMKGGSDYELLLCLSDGRLLSVNKQTDLRLYSAAEAENLLWKAYLYDAFFLLRPGQAAE